ncbi:MAG: Fe(2+)-trafficking protein [Dehalococcoidia bacterium]
MAAITCSRCEQNKDQLSEAPVGGVLGETIVERICTGCWDEWRETSARLINHYGLNLGMPDHRKELRRAMKEFLGLPE